MFKFKFTIVLPFLFQLLAGSLLAQGDDCTITVLSSTSDFNQNRLCAPVEVDWHMSVSAVENGKTVRFIYNWNDGSGTVDIIPATEITPGVYSADERVYHTYPAGGNQCAYNPQVFIEVDGFMCATALVSPSVKVHDVDIYNGGELIIEPEIYRVCAGTEATVTFEDLSQWNCTPPNEFDDLNKESRWVQFIYNTKTEPGTRINNVEVDGSLIDINNELPGAVDIIPEPALASDAISLPIYVPTTANVGEIFEITLRNWNKCNPYATDGSLDPVNGNYADGDSLPVTQTAHILVVAPPETKFETRSSGTSPEKTQFCPDESVYLKNQTTTSGGVIAYTWTFFDENDVEIFPVSTDNGIDKITSFSTPGIYKIVLEARDQDAAGACISTFEKTIEIIATPIADIEVFDDGGNELTDLNFCEITGGYDLNFVNATNFTGTVEYTWVLDKVKPSDSSFVSTILNPIPTTTKTDLPATINAPGLYRITLTAKEIITQCSNTEIKYLSFHNTPQAEFEVSSFTELCVGREIIFDDNSLDFVTQASGFEEDTIKTYRWWFDWDPANPAALPDAEVDTTGMKHIFSSVKNYKVRLEVENSYGCTDEFILSLDIDPVPIAAFTPDQDEICSGETVTFTNDVAGIQPSPVVIDKYEWIIIDNEDSTIVALIEQSATDTELEYTFVHNKAMQNEHEFKVYLQAYAEGVCSTLSSPDTIKVYPTVQGKFDIPDYDPLDSNCSPLSFDFIVDQATLDLPFDKDYRWTISDLNGEVFTSGVVSQPDLNAADYPALTNPDSISVKEYTITLEVIPGNPVDCIKPFSRKIEVNPNPSAKFVATVTLECSSAMINLNSYQKGLKTSDYEWTISETASNFPVEDDNFDLYFERKAVDYYVDVALQTTNFAGCQSQWQLPESVLIPALESIATDFDYDLIENCTPATANFENLSTVPANTTFNLFIGKGGNTPVEVTDYEGNLENNFDYTFTDAGEYVVILKATTPDGCVAEHEETVTINARPEALFETPDQICGGESFTPVNQSSDVNFIQEYIWTVTNESGTAIYGPSNDLPVNLALENITGASIEFEVSLEVVSTEGCRDSFSEIITVAPQPVAEFEIITPMPVCDPFEIEFKNNSNGNPAGTIYTWMWGSETEDNNDKSVFHTFENVSYSNQKTVNVKLKAETPDGCIFISDPQEVFLSPLIQTSIEVNKAAFCAPEEVVLFNYSAVPAIHQWYIKEKGSYDSTLFSTEAAPVFNSENNSSSTKEYLIRYIGENGGGCFATDSLLITVHPETRAEFEYTMSQGCSPLEITFTNMAIAEGNANEDIEYTWDWGDGTSTVSGDPTISHTFTNGSFTNKVNVKVALTAYNTVSQSCSDTYFEFITLEPAVRADIRSDKTEGCAPLEVQFENLSQGVSQHEWFYVNKTTGTRIDGSTLNSSNAQYTFENNTDKKIIYDVIYTASNNACSDDDTVSITVYPEIIASYTASPEKQSLPESTVTINNTTRNGATYEYKWDYGDGMGTSDKRNPDPYTYGTYGEYTITLTVTDQYGLCESVAVQSIVIAPTVPLVDFDYEPGSGCSPLTVNFINKSKYADKTTYRWDFGDNSSSFSTKENPTYTYYKPGNYTVSLEASNEIGVTVTETKVNIIQVYENPRALFQVRFYEVALNEEIQVDNRSTGGSSFFWDFGDGFTSEEVEPSHAYSQSGEFDITLIVTSETGCKDTLKVIGAVKAKSEFDIDLPNAFAPESSIGENSVFLPHINKAVSEYNLLIYNRWGELLFESKNREQGWNGYYNGKLSPQDVYIYKLKVKFTDGEETVRVGDVTLVR